MSSQVETGQHLHANESDNARTASGEIEAGTASGAEEVEGKKRNLTFRYIIKIVPY
jgi:hypothetical protein